MKTSPFNVYYNFYHVTPLRTQNIISRVLCTKRVTQKDEPWQAKEVGLDKVEKIAPNVVLVEGVAS